jgi:hypothetical protein
VQAGKIPLHLPECDDLSPAETSVPSILIVSLFSAVDYLYVSQPLWEENKKVLAWVRSDQSTMDILLKPCDGPACGKKETQPCQFQGCSACKTVNCASFYYLLSLPLTRY